VPRAQGDGGGRETVRARVRHHGGRVAQRHPRTREVELCVDIGQHDLGFPANGRLHAPDRG
jgi:hypothetical protein